MLQDKRSQSRRRLDQRFNRHNNISELEPPWQGWIRTLRDALGMTGADLARRMGVHQSRIPAIERGEREQTIKIDTLARAAEALDCDSSMCSCLAEASTKWSLIRPDAEPLNT